MRTRHHHQNHLANVRDRILLLFIGSTLVLKELWTLIPRSDEPRKMFPFSDTLIHFETYVWFICFYAIQLILVHVWYSKFDKYQLIFKVWFIFQALEFVEFVLTYNEPKLWFHVYGHQVDITLINIKLLVVTTMIIDKVWKDK